MLACPANSTVAMSNNRLVLAPVVVVLLPEALEDNADLLCREWWVHEPAVHLLQHSLPLVWVLLLGEHAHRQETIVPCALGEAHARQVLQARWPICQEVIP